jgi:hypothetical protein
MNTNQNFFAFFRVHSRLISRLKIVAAIGFPSLRQAQGSGLRKATGFQEQAAIPCKIPTDGRNQNNPAHGAGKSRGLSKQAESGGAGRGAWEISPAK